MYKANPFPSIFTARKRSLGQVNVFTGACHSVHREVGWLPACITGHVTGEDLPPRGLPWGDCIRGVSIQNRVCLQGRGLHLREVGQTPPPSTTGYGQQAGGTHPTGMHYCVHITYCKPQSSSPVAHSMTAIYLHSCVLHCQGKIESEQDIEGIEK